MPLEPWSAVLLFLTCFWGPLLAIQSARRLGSGPLPVGRQRLFVQTIIIQAILFGVAFLASRRTGVPLVAAPPAFAVPWLIAAALVLLGVILLRWRWASRSNASKYRLYTILPHTAGEYGPYLILCLAAGIGEEYAYRGMLLAILRYLTGNLIASVLIASVAFALAHALQGVRGMFAIFLIALAAHGLVLYAATLLPAIVAHAVYDAVAGWLIPRLYERDAAISSASCVPA
jgi:membrane protease YdiL (CAAX protease family)